MGIDPVICPRCESDETLSENDFFECAKEIRKCYKCNCEYDVYYEFKVKEIKIKN